MNDYILIKKKYLVLGLVLAITFNLFFLGFANGKAQSYPAFSEFFRSAQFYENQAVSEKHNGYYLLAYAYYYAYFLTDIWHYYYAEDPDYFNYYQDEMGKKYDRIVERLDIADSCDNGRVYASFLMPAMRIPTKMVKICEDWYLGGKCFYLPVGAYPDLSRYDIGNGISSFDLGSKVKLRVCYYTDLKTPCKMFYARDDDLADNRSYSRDVGGNFSWNDNIKSVEVFLR